MSEEWRVIAERTSYQVSNVGRVRRALFSSNRKGKPGDLIKPIIGPNGYPSVALWENGHSKRFSVHRLVAFAFLGAPPTLSHEVAHLDGDKTNNKTENLAWVTRKENHSHKHLHGTAQVGSRNPNHKLDEEKVREIRRRDPSNLSALAREFGVSQVTIRRVIDGQLWKHVDLKEIR